MSRITLLLLGSALMLIVAACESNGDDADTDTSVENGTEESAGSDSNGEDEDVTQEDEATEETSDESGSEEESTAEDDEVAESDQEEATEPAEEGTQQPEQEGTPGAEGTQQPEQEGTPGPQEGLYFDLTVEEANEMTDFEVKEPQEIPEGVEFQSILGMASQQESEEQQGEDERSAATIIFSYTQPPEDESQQPLPVELTQSSELDMTATLPPDTDQESVTVGDREVTRVSVQDQSGNDILAFMWNENDIHYSLAAIMGPDLEESELENMVASIPAS